MRSFIDIVEGQETVLYHLTLSRNVPKILAAGLVPKIGARSKKLGEKSPAIYFFPSIEDAITALNQWMGDAFSEEARIALLAVSVPEGVEVHSTVDYERHVYDLIPGENIRVLHKDVLGATEQDLRALAR